MVFSSLFFVFVFLVLTMAVYLLVPQDKRNFVLLAASLLFYSWGGPRYLFLLLGEVWVSWFCALRVKENKAWLWVDVAALLGLLGIFKYTGFVLGTVQQISGWPAEIPQIVLPIGISFYTFQLLSYVADVARGDTEAQPRYWKLLLYASLFHQCIAGPIVRYQTVAHEIDHRSVTVKDVYDGIRRFSVGLAKKAILANGCAKIADTLFVPGAVSGLSMSAYWLGTICYMLQLYLDFSAYSDMAIGMGRMVGFHYLENFNYPYMATSIQDFWRRWHISLSSFFRDYVYIPLGGSRCTPWTYVRNMVVVWFLTGLWHGASWNFVLWGLYYLAFLLFERFGPKIPKGWNRLYVLSVVLVGSTIFKFDNMSELWTVLKGMVGIGVSGFGAPAVTTLFLGNVFLLAVSVIACTNLGVLVHNALFHLGKENKITFLLYNAFETLVPPVLICLSFLALIGNAYNPFIYFRF